jgi:hypothetical protein
MKTFEEFLREQKEKEAAKKIDETKDKYKKNKK